MVNSIHGSGNGIIGIQQQQDLQQIQQEAPVSAKRIQAFSDSDSLSMSGPSANFKSQLSPELMGGIDEMLSGLNAEDKSTVLSAGKNIAKSLTSAAGAASSEGEIINLIGGDMADIAKTLGSGDGNMLTNQSVLAAYAGVNDDLMGFANKVNNNNNAKSTLRENVSMLQDEVTNWPEGVETQDITYTELTQNADGSFTEKEVTKPMTKAEVQNLIDSMNSQKDTISEMSQMDMLNLQNAMNQQSQLMQTLSNIMKVMHDTAKSIIQNLR